MREFFGSTGPLWSEGALIGKVGSVFCSCNTQHGGQGTTIISTQVTLLQHGMIVVGIPYSQAGRLYVEGMSGGSPYGASRSAGPEGSRQPSENELALARYQGRGVAEISKRLVG